MRISVSYIWGFKDETLSEIVEAYGQTNAPDVVTAMDEVFVSERDDVVFFKVVSSGSCKVFTQVPIDYSDWEQYDNDRRLEANG